MRAGNNEAPVPAANPITVSKADDVSLAEADALREARYAGLSTIEDVLALPGEFSELEALTALAARLDSSGVQALLFEAMRVDDPWRREAFVELLLVRLVEVDPRTALAVADGPLRRTGRNYTGRVWRLWARLDFDTALAQAALTDGDRRVMAAAFYAALPDLSDPRAADIESVLGLAATAQERNRRMGALYTSDPDAAMAKILTASETDSVYVSELAKAMYVDLGVEALDQIERIPSDRIRNAMLAMVFSDMAQDDPEAAIRNYSRMGTNRDNGIANLAIGQLAATDPDLAFELIDLLPGKVRKGAEARVIGSTANKDLDKAMQMLSSMRYGNKDAALQQIVRSAASRDFDAALAMLDTHGSPTNRETLLRAMIDYAPKERISELIDRMGDGMDRWQSRFAKRNLIQTWARRDPAAAMAWAQSQPEGQRGEFMGEVAAMSAAEDIDSTASLLASLPAADASALARRVSESLARQGLIDEALAMSAQLPDEEGRRAAQMTALRRIALEEPKRALELARQTGDVAVVDAMLATTLVRNSGGALEDAFASAREISDPDSRSATQRSVAMRWASSDADAARRAAESLPPGIERDNLYVGLVTSPGVSADEAETLIGRIGDLAARQNAEIMLVVRLAEVDVARARALADSLDLQPFMRQQLESVLRQRGLR
ncbi:MAG: hypothetical protein AAFY69_08685 [Pseudomonadota bacterium]